MLMLLLCLKGVSRWTASTEVDDEANVGFSTVGG
jgi:hypothetical protein